MPPEGKTGDRTLVRFAPTPYSRLDSAVKLNDMQRAASRSIAAR